MPPKLFSKDDRIEVRKVYDVVIWHPATVLRSSLSQLHVQYKALHENDDPVVALRKDTVGYDDVRPAPPSELHRHFKVGEEVEGLCTQMKGWRKGRILDILENSRYKMSFESGGGTGYVAELEQWKLRAVRKWCGGVWVPSFPLQEVLQKSSEPKIKARGLVLKIKCNGRASRTQFGKGMVVEVKSNEDGYIGSWFSAVIVAQLENNKFLVEYRTLRTEGKTEFLREEVDISCIRPSPSVVQQVVPFQCLEQIDAWYNDGWWEGYIVKITNGCKYVVHFPKSDEQMMFELWQLRPHQEWVNGVWSSVPKVNLADANFNGEVRLKRRYIDEAPQPTFQNGMMVEVKSDEEGYQGSWYTAEIISSFGNDKYLVEYQTLKTDDESELLRYETFASYIRPCPPKLVRVDRFRMLEEVDAWYNEGWWVGLVSKVLDNVKYAVYFWTTNEEIIFDHFSLRPHQEWVGGKWIVAFRKKSKFSVKTRLGKCKGQTGRIGGVKFTKGTKVEVKSDEEGFNGSWYPAVIMRSVGNRKYMVEYQILQTDNGTQLHKEEADAFCIRPCPPLFQ